MSDRPPGRPDLGALDASPFTAWRRLHPAAIAVWGSGLVGNLAFPIVVFALIGRADGPLGIFVLIALLGVVGSVVRWTRFRFRIDGDTLMMRGGLVQRWERTIQRRRIQSVDVVRKLTHRLCGVVELRIEVVGGQGTEGSLVALTPHDADVLRGMLIADRAPEVDEREPPLVRMSAGDLLLAGLTGGRVAVLAGLVAWAMQLLPEGVFVRTLDRVAGADRSDLETLVVVAGGFVLASVAISIVSTIVVYWGFTAERHGDRLVITRGLLQTRRSVVPLRRIQSIRIEENLIRRAFGLGSLRVLTAGYGKQSGDEQQTSTLAPIAPRTRCREIAATVLRTDDLTSLPLRSASRSALWVRLVRAAVVVVGVAVAARASLEDALSLWIVATVAAAGFSVAVLSWRGLGHAVTGRHLVIRWGGLLRRTAVANGANVQHLVLRRSPIQRLFGIATVTLAIPRGSASMIDLERPVADQRFEEVAALLLDSLRDPARTGHDP